MAKLNCVNEIRQFKVKQYYDCYFTLTKHTKIVVLTDNIHPICGKRCGGRGATIIAPGAAGSAFMKGGGGGGMMTEPFMADDGRRMIDSSGGSTFSGSEEIDGCFFGFRDDGGRNLKVCCVTWRVALTELVC